MANREFASALKRLRLKYKLSQAAVAGVVGITQPEYSAFERLKRKLNLDDADNISKKLWGKSYDEFVSFASKEIDIEALPKTTQEIIEKASGKKITDTSNLLATELDRLISEGHFGSPTTSKLVHAEMNNKLANRKTSEITSLLGRSPRNKQIVSIGKYGSQKIYIHQNHAAQYEKMSNEELAALIAKQKNKDTDDKKNKGTEND
ncbi:helix-turn-helix domain-containing protein [Parapedobacter soli]|uniref:helix-turn-helix domain-containing protein n=1 Tax=Parapedobacter soli TaxID=416955 RepID=UPI0021C732EB|nr:helix-turn-helix transcriptional regulator [Parapedobacter soli]